MQLNVSELDDGIKLISLQGRMDILGTQEIDTLLTANISSEAARIIIDMAGVEFISSLGIGVIVRAANALLKREGKIVLMNPQPNVFSAIKSTAITKVVPIFYNMASARSFLRS